MPRLPNGQTGKGALMYLWLPAVAIALGMPPPESRELMLAGTLDGRLGIHMTLKIDAGRATGSYSYDRYRKPIPLRGSLGENASLLLDELDARGGLVAQFRGTLDSASFEG